MGFRLPSLSGLRSLLSTASPSLTTTPVPLTLGLGPGTYVPQPTLADQCAWAVSEAFRRTREARETAVAAAKIPKAAMSIANWLKTRVCDAAKAGQPLELIISGEQLMGADPQRVARALTHLLSDPYSMLQPREGPTLGQRLGKILSGDWAGLEGHDMPNVEQFEAALGNVYLAGSEVSISETALERTIRGLRTASVSVTTHEPDPGAARRNVKTGLLVRIDPSPDHLQKPLSVKSTREEANRRIFETNCAEVVRKLNVQWQTSPARAGQAESFRFVVPQQLVRYLPQGSGSDADCIELFTRWARALSGHDGFDIHIKLETRDGPVIELTRRNPHAAALNFNQTRSTSVYPTRRDAGFDSMYADVFPQMNALWENSQAARGGADVFRFVVPQEFVHRMQRSSDADCMEQLAKWARSLRRSSDFIVSVKLESRYGPIIELVRRKATAVPVDINTYRRSHLPAHQPETVALPAAVYAPGHYGSQAPIAAAGLGAYAGSVAVH